MNLQDEIWQIAREHLNNVAKAGPNNLKATCPFHLKEDGSPERSPSFHMSIITGLWICFACHEAGNLRAFLRSVGVAHARIEQQYRFVIDEAAKASPRPIDPLRPGVVTEMPLPESLLGVFEFCPIDLLNEGFDEEVLERFDVGFDKQHMRITFPMRDIEGNLFGINGRTVTDAEPRYKVYDKEYDVFGLPPRTDGETKKRITIWNADRLYPASLSTVGFELVLVEGYKACMWVHQAGITNVGALIGSFMSEEQRLILERMATRVYLMLDNDPAGQKGTLQIGERLSRSIDVQVICYGDEERYQPDQVELEEVQEAKDNAIDFFRWRRDDS